MTKENSPYVRTESGLLILYEFIEGEDSDPEQDAEAIGVLAGRLHGEPAGIASACKECESMWQINLDVLPSYQAKGLAPALVNALTLEVLRRGLIPYYNTDCSNIRSQRTEIRAGYFPAWTHCFRTRLEPLDC
jgi:GNAT superfamily N-acetyltransferase